jgi:hypothetical protein
MTTQHGKIYQMVEQETRETSSNMWGDKWFDENGNDYV